MRDGDEYTQKGGKGEKDGMQTGLHDEQAVRG